MKCLRPKDRELNSIERTIGPTAREEAITRAPAGTLLVKTPRTKAWCEANEDSSHER
jgi:hypothetical protein